jgi:hypothetical protein
MRFSDDETFVWKILSNYSGSLIRDAEDRFVRAMANRHRDTFSSLAPDPVFGIISARKAVRIPQKHPKRTPGLGLRARGTGASAENNAHVSVADETKIWDKTYIRIVKNGLPDIISAVNRKKTELVFDPEA